ncbi:MAG: hypothetical protein ACR2QO_26180 [Acidimicrobiales bacterium]
MPKSIVLAVLTALFLLLGSSPAAAQSSSDDGSVLVRVNGDVTIPDDETHGLVLVVDGDLDIAGTATTVVVISGRANLAGATVETLVVVDGVAELGAATRITGDVRLVESAIVRDPSATVEGSIETGTGDFTRGFWLIGFLFMIGWAVMMLLASLLLAAVAPDFARRSGRTITADLGPAILAGLVVWIAVPVLGVFLFATLIGLPTALMIWFALLPALGLIGFLVAGVRVGEYLTGGTEGVGHPFLAAFVGVLILLVVGAIPVVGPLVVTVAGFLGSGALALRAFRSATGRPMAGARPSAPEPVPTTAGDRPAANFPAEDLRAEELPAERLPAEEPEEES